MSYRVLARKWRLQTFSELVGQRHIIKALSYALENDNVHHAYLFTGTRGVGKTSIARIFARSLNCETNGVSSNPCGSCTNCLDISMGKFVDLIEVDAASRTGVDETRELIDSIAYLPAKGRYKVYLIDEVHMFSKSSFNALLKTLEEPPEYVKFILATTDPEKLPITVLSRCLQFNLKALRASQISDHLKMICQEENIDYEEQAIDLISKAGKGSVRDSLSIMDQAIAYGQGSLKTDTINELLGTINPADVQDVLHSLVCLDSQALYAKLRKLDDYDIDTHAFLIEMMQQLQKMAWNKEGINITTYDIDNSDISTIPKELIQLWYDIADKGLIELQHSDDMQQSMEMTILRMLAFVPKDIINKKAIDTSAPIKKEKLISREIANQSSLEKSEEDFVRFSQLREETKQEETKQEETKQEETKQEETKQEETKQEETKQEETKQEETKQEETKQEETKQEETKQEETKQEETKQEETKQEETKQEETKQEETKQEETKQEETKQEETKQEETKQEETKQEETKQEETKQEETKQEETKQEETKQEETKQEETKQEETKQEETKQEETKQEETKQEETGWHLSSDTESNDIPSMDDINKLMQRGNQIKTKDVKLAKESLDTDKQKISPEIDLNEINKKVYTQEPFDWFDTFSCLNVSDFTKQFAGSGDLIWDEKTNKATLTIAPKNEVLKTKESVIELESELKKIISPMLCLEVVLGDVGFTPSDQIILNEKNLKNKKIQNFKSDPIVNALVDEMGAIILEKTIK